MCSFRDIRSSWSKLYLMRFVRFVNMPEISYIYASMDKRVFTFNTCGLVGRFNTRSTRPFRLRSGTKPLWMSETKQIELKKNELPPKMALSTLIFQDCRGPSRLRVRVRVSLWNLLFFNDTEIVESANLWWVCNFWRESTRDSSAEFISRYSTN